MGQLPLFDLSAVPQAPIEWIPHDRRYPAELVEAALGPECVRELRRAKPGSPADTGPARDRFLVNPGAIGYWLYFHFGINIFAAEADGIDVDPLGETIAIRGERYGLPHWCYLGTGLEPGDRRPARWPGIPRPGETAPCERCGKLCRASRPKNPQGRPFQRSPRGLCPACVVTGFLKEMWGDIFAQQGVAILSTDACQRQFAAILKAGGSDLQAEEINWQEIVDKWDLPFPSKKKGRRKKAQMRTEGGD
jgi:hypothetical protein